MKLKAFTYLATALLGVALGAAAADAQVTLVSQGRFVSTNGCSPPQGSSHSAPDFGPFNVTATNFCAPPQNGVAIISQNSTLSSSQFTCSQTANSLGNAGCDGLFQVVFDAVQPVLFSITGTTNRPVFTIQLTGPGGDDLFTPISNETRTESGVLPPGRYTIRSNIFGGSAIPDLPAASLTMSFTNPPFTIDWYTIDDGGTLNNIGGPYNVSGAIGQCDSTARATLTGGALSITGGFWAVGLPRCDADINNDGIVNSQDFFDFLSAFFASNPLADFNRDGAINSQDFFDFLSAFFAGCP